MTATIREGYKTDPEYRLQFPKSGEQEVHVAASGSVDCYPEKANRLAGVTDSGSEYDVRLIVGPYWNDITAVVPKVTIDGVLQHNADEDDKQAFVIRDLSWDSVGEQGPKRNLLRIRLKFTVAVWGEESYVNRLGYAIFARGMRRDELSIDEPGPVAPQG